MTYNIHKREDPKTDMLDAEDVMMSALEDVVGRKDFDTLDDDAIINLLAQYGITSAQDIDELMGDIAAVKRLDKNSAEQRAQDMANEDNTNVTVTEEDSDDDGDTDKVTIEKESFEDDDSGLTDEEEEMLNALETDDDTSDTPHDENSTNRFATLLSGYKLG